MKYVPISFKSDYSLLKSMIKIKDIISFAVANDSNYVGILDDNPYGIMDFYEKCISNGLKCIFGMIVKIGDNKIYLYVKDYHGYKNIIKINDLVQDNKLTINDIFKYNEGIICVLPFEHYNLFNRFKTVFEVYLGYKNEIELKNASLITKKVLFVNEIQCFNKNDRKLLEILYKIAGNQTCEYENYILEASEADVKTIEEFQANIDLHFELDKRYIRKYCKTLEESRNLLFRLSNKGLEKRLNGKVSEEYRKRLEYELSIIDSMGFIDYFLVVYDYVKFAKQNNICVGPGRGSAAGSLVSYTLGITDVDPIKYDLLFERFLNPKRITMPDIDIDFEDIRRGEVIDYVRHKYGENAVSLIVAYGTFGARQSVRDIGKIMGIEESVISELSKQLNPKLSLKENLNNKSLVEFIKAKKLETIYKVSMKFEGLKKNTTIHAAGVLICDRPLLELVPTIKNGDALLTGFTKEYLEMLGLLKMDFLGVRNLTTLNNTAKLVKGINKNFNLKEIPLNDAKTFKILSSGNTDGIFQFETPGMTKFLKKLEPETFDDLVAAVALFRPGPMDNIDEYIKRRKGLIKVSYIHNDLENILKSTYGIIIYQEQIMQILALMGGYDFAEADLIRRAMSKKKKDVMENERVKFISESVNRGYEENIAKAVYDLIVKFANYGFNKAHSVAYALVGYQMAYLKANYMEQFSLNTLNMNIGSDAKTKDVIEDAKNKGLKIIKPSVNRSQLKYVIENGELILPLTTIKNVSSLQSKIIVENAPYSDYFDFFKKINGKGVNKMLVETLIKAGALEDFSKSKKTLLSNIDSALTYVELVNNLDESLVMKPELEVSQVPDEEYSEIDIFGFYVSGHPSLKYQGPDRVKIKDVEKFMGRKILLVGLVEKVKVINTKKGEEMAFVDINDETKTIDCVIFPRNNVLIKNLIVGELYKVWGQVTKKGEEVQIIISDVESMEK